MQTNLFDVGTSLRVSYQLLLKINSFLLTYLQIPILVIYFDLLCPFNCLIFVGSNSFQNASRNTSENNLANPANASGTNQQQTMQEIDDRLKKEVLSLGLIDQSAINKIVYNNYFFLFMVICEASFYLFS